MALLFIDGFDHYTENQATDKGWVFAAPSTVWSSSYARFGIGQGIVVTNSGSYGHLMRKNIGVNKATVYMGIAFYKSGLNMPEHLNSAPFITFADESEVQQVRIHINPNYGISAYQGDDTLLGSSSNFIISNSKWFYIEAKITISATVGVVEVKLNGTQVLNLTSQDTKNGSDYIRHIAFGSIDSSNDTLFDDFWIDDAVYHGDCRIRTFTPDSISPTNDSFTASAGNKDECVDESPSNDDTDYIISDTLNHKQGFGITTGALGTVEAIQLNNHCRLDEAGTRKITPLIRSNSADYQGTETDEIAADWHFEHEIWETDPDDSGAWDQTKLEAAEFGLEITT